MSRFIPALIVLCACTSSMDASYQPLAEGDDAERLHSVGTSHLLHELDSYDRGATHLGETAVWVEFYNAECTGLAGYPIDDLLIDAHSPAHLLLDCENRWRTLESGFAERNGILMYGGQLFEAMEIEGVDQWVEAEDLAAEVERPWFSHPIILGPNHVGFTSDEFLHLAARDGANGLWGEYAALPVDNVNYIARVDGQDIAVGDRVYRQNWAGHWSEVQRFEGHLRDGRDGRVLEWTTEEWILHEYTGGAYQERSRWSTRQATDATLLDDGRMAWTLAGELQIRDLDRRLLNDATIGLDPSDDASTRLSSNGDSLLLTEWSEMHWVSLTPGYDDAWLQEDFSMLGTEWDNEWAEEVVYVPPGTTRLSVRMDGLGEADLFVTRQMPIDAETAACVSEQAGADEYCAITDPEPGTWYVGIHAGEEAHVSLTVRLDRD